MSTIKINRDNKLKDFFDIVFFIVAVICGTLLINAFVFRSYNIVGASMEDTLHDGERIIVDRLPVTWSQIKNETYVPKRGQIIVFENPKMHKSNTKDRYLIKRVIGLPGDRVVVKNGKITVYTKDKPSGINPDLTIDDSPRKPVSGNVDVIVPEKEIFVVGDHRDGQNSYDSRSGLGTVPFYNIIGPVSLRLLPLDKIRTFN